MTATKHRHIAKAAVALVALVALLSACMGAEQSEAFDALNHDRNAWGRASLTENGMLSGKAQSWAEHLAAVNSLSHSTLTDGISGCWRMLGENVGYGGSIQAVENAFMNSSGHRANILNASYNQVGLGVATNGSRVFVVQVFMQAC